ncbi:MAG: DUF3231 family protein [Firmicutes bacterium]|nr:DUF3231 family protein [Bacillota bacterium]
MKLVKLGEKISYLTKSTREKQTTISFGEAYHLWYTLVSRYDALHLTNILDRFTKDEDLKRILHDGLEILNSQIFRLESAMKEFGIPMPNKPPEQANINLDVNAITDQTIFRQIFDGLRHSLLLYTNNFNQSPTSTIRELFRGFLKEEMELLDKLFEYGKLKGYLNEIPTFRS